MPVMGSPHGNHALVKAMPALVAELGAGEQSEPMACRLQEARPHPLGALAAPMADVIALTALGVPDYREHRSTRATGNGT